MDPRVAGLARLLEFDGRRDGHALAAVIVERAADLGAAFALEAAASDDVHDAASAASYLDLRLASLADLVPDAALPSIREAFARQTAGW